MFNLAFDFLLPLLNPLFSPDSFLLSAIKLAGLYILLFVFAYLLFDLPLYNHFMILVVIILIEQACRNIATLISDSFLLIPYSVPYLIQKLIHFGVFAIIAPLMFLLFRKRIPEFMETKLSAHAIAIMALIFVIMGAMHLFSQTLLDNNIPIYLASLIWNIAICGSLLGLIALFFGKFRSEQEAAVASYLWEEDRKRYKSLEENIAIISIKCHDLRYQMEKEEETKKAVDEVDSIYATGNRTLDVVLSDKSMRCLIKEIPFTAMADGKAISFLADTDLFSLFHNAIDNAIEYEETLPKENRFISVVVKRNGGMCLIRIENRFEGELVLSNGLPTTTKEDKTIHGYGTKSIARVVEKYGGSLSITNESGVFTLVAVFFNKN
ncbi:MAG: sensor histidine kinase [Bacilli bacterium]|nr:sensor histidine kinase [Bacilli bacterium]